MSVLSNENLPTISAVAFVLALLGLAVASFNTIKINQTATAVAAFELRDARQEKTTGTARDATVQALEARLAKLEAAQAAAAAPAADGSGEAAPATK